MTTPLLFSRIASGDGSGGITPPKRTDQSPPAGSPDFRAMFRTMVAGLPPAHGSPPQPPSSGTNSSVTQLAFSTMLGVQNIAQRSVFTNATMTSTTMNLKTAPRMQESASSVVRTSSAPSRESVSTSTTPRRDLSTDESRTPVERMTLRDLVRVAVQDMRTRRESAQASPTVLLKTQSAVSAKQQVPVQKADSAVSAPGNAESVQPESSAVAQTSPAPIERTQPNAQSDARVQANDDTTKQVAKKTTADNHENEDDDKKTEPTQSNTQPLSNDSIAMLGSTLFDVMLAVSSVFSQAMAGQMPSGQMQISDIQQALLQDTTSATALSTQAGQSTAQGVDLLSDIGKSKDALLTMMQAVQAPLGQLGSAMSGLLSTLQSIQDSLGGANGAQSPVALQTLPDGNVGVIVPVNAEQLQTPLSPDHVQQWQMKAEQSLSAVNTALTTLQQTAQARAGMLPADMQQALQAELQSLTTHIQSMPTQTSAHSSDELLQTVIELALQNMAGIAPNGKNTEQATAGTTSLQKQDFAPPQITEIALQVPAQSLQSTTGQEPTTPQSLPTLGDIAELVQQFSAHDQQAPSIKIMLMNAPTPSVAANNQQLEANSQPLANTLQSIPMQPMQSAQPVIETPQANALTEMPLSANTASLASSIADSVPQVSVPQVSVPQAQVQAPTDVLLNQPTPLAQVPTPSVESPHIPTVDTVVQSVIANAPKSPFQAAPTAPKQPAINALHDIVLGDSTPMNSIPSGQKAEITAMASAGSQAGLQAGLQGGAMPQTMPSTQSPTSNTQHAESAFAEASLEQAQANEQSKASHEAIGTGFETIDAKQSAQSTKLPLELMAKTGGQFAQIFKDVAPQDIPRTITQAFRGFTPMAGGVGGAIQLQLNPEHLGGVMVQVLVKNMSASISIETDSADAQRAVEAQIATLKERLTAQGLKVETVEISTRPQNDPAGLDMNRQGQSSQAQRDERESRQAFVDSFRHHPGAGSNTRPTANANEPATAHDLLRRMKSGVSSNAHALNGQRNFERYA